MRGQYFFLGCIVFFAGVITHDLIFTFGEMAIFFDFKALKPSKKTAMGLYGRVQQSAPVEFTPSSSILVTGAAGFIGMHVCIELEKLGIPTSKVVALDNFNGYYSPAYKRARAAHLLNKTGIEVLDADVCDDGKLRELFDEHRFTHVVHLAAQPGVRYAASHPMEYVERNLDCYVRLLETIVHRPEDDPRVHFVYASSSSVYGLNTKVPLAESDRVDRPASLYGATKKANEELALSYHNVYGLESVGLRFFTVYGPWGRPDMAVYKFTDQIIAGKAIRVFNNGKMKRDFTYIDDIVAGIIAAMRFRDVAHHPQVFNLGNSEPVAVEDFVHLLEVATNTSATVIDAGESKGEVDATYASTVLSRDLLKYNPKTSMPEGLKHFIEWYHSPYRRPEFSETKGRRI